jgi:glycosyltransferase involved in cell wall biosynthesis
LKKRVLYLVQEYPQLSETYIYNEIENVSHLYELEIFSMRQANLPYKNHRSYCIGGTDPKNVLDNLVEQFAPQVAHFHYMTLARQLLSFCEHYGIPFTVRAHSFDVLTGFDPESPSYLEKIAQYVEVVQSEQCLGVLTFPFTCEYFLKCGVDEDKLHPAFPVVDVQRFFDKSENGDAIINVGAALDKKAMSDFLRLANLIPERTFNLFPIGYDISKLRDENAAINGRCHIHDAVQPEQMPPIYKQHRWLVYTADKMMKNVGWPLAVAEAQAAGVGVCLANVRSDLKDYLGEGGGILYDDIEELRDILPGEVPNEMRERGFELCWRSDIRKNISQLTDLWERV